MITPPHPAGLIPQDDTQDDSRAACQGAWEERTGGYRGGHHALESDETGEPSARWTFSGLRPLTTYAVFATWDPDMSNTDQAAFELLDGSTPAQPSVIVNQRQIAGDSVEHDRSWQRLAHVTLAGDTLNVVVRPVASDGLVVADAVRIVEMSGTEFVSYDLRGNIIANGRSGTHAAIHL